MSDLPLGSHRPGLPGPAPLLPSIDALSRTNSFQDFASIQSALQTAALGNEATFGAVLLGEARQLPAKLRTGPLKELGLVDDNGWPNYRLTTLGARGRAPLSFITDLPWHNTLPNAVFPWTDESHVLLDYATRNLNLNEYTGLVDPAAGCGHTPITMPDIVGPRFALDVNPRAIQLIGLNAAINDVPVYAQENDIQQGLPQFVLKGIGNRPLFVMNGPFALSPQAPSSNQGDALPLTTDGGREGTRYTLAGLRALTPFTGSQGRALVLGMSLLHDDGSWRLVDQARAILPDAEVSFIVPSMRNWRVNGRKVQPNPFPVERMATKSSCILQYPSRANRRAIHNSYRVLATGFKAQGYSRLGTVLLDILL